jgi:hypothetical protein
LDMTREGEMREREGKTSIRDPLILGLEVFLVDGVDVKSK